MHIIFGNSQELNEKYTVLELDTIRIIAGGPVHTAYCVLENIPIEELPAVETLTTLHTTLMENYRTQKWADCDRIIAQLMGKWGGEVDSFYIELNNRIADLKTQTLDSNWSGIIEKL
jgi:hypothetical protein